MNGSVWGVATFERNPYEDVVVLVVEDELQTRTLIKHMLHRLGVVWVKEAQDGLSGLAAVLASKPHLVLCDIHMEPFDGFEFLQRLRALGDPMLRQTPVVFLTGDRMSDSVTTAMDLKVNGYLLKPVALWDLQTHLDAALNPA
jgi:two-component system chemotaxis response regulator CheY